MKKIIRLTESDLIKLVNRVIKEQEFDYDMERSFGGRRGETEPEISFDKNLYMIANKNDEEVSEFLSNIPEETKFISIVDCEFADFNGVDLCSTEIYMVRITGTPTNFKSQNYPCLSEEIGEGFYSLNI
jgi:hypothetical protein